MTVNRDSILASPNRLIDSIAKASLVGAIFFTPLGTAPANILMVSTILAWLAAGGYRQRFIAIKDNHFAWSALGLYGLLWVGVAYTSGDAPDIRHELQKYSKLLFILLAITLLQEEKWRNRGLAAFALAMFVTLVLSMINVVWPLSIAKGTSTNSFVFKDYIVQNLMMSFFVLLMLVKSREQSSKLRRLAYLALAACAMANILLFVFGRTGYLSLAAVLAVFIAFYIPPRQRWQWLIAALLAGLALFYFSDTFRGRINQAATEFQNRDANQPTSVGQRVEFFRKSVELIKERPLAGWGTGAYPKEFCRIALTEEWCMLGKFHPHNQFLAFGVQLGLLGILGYLTFFACALRQAWHFNRPEKVLAIGLAGALLVDSFLHAPLFLVTEAQFFTLMLAVVLARAHPQNATIELSGSRQCAVR